MRNPLEIFIQKEHLIHKKLRSNLKIHWTYVRFFYFNHLFNQRFESQKSKKFVRSFKYLKAILGSLFRLKKNKETFLIASSKEAQSVIKHFKLRKRIDSKESLDLSVLTYNTADPGFVYVDLIKIIARLGGNFVALRYSKPNKRIVTKLFIESIWMTRLFKVLFKLIRPQKIFIINWYTFYPAVVAAQQLKIEVHEVQHGIIHKEHPGYNMSSKIEVKHLPNTFHLWDEKFSKHIRIPAQLRFEYFGFPMQLSEQLTPQKGKSILIISQASISTEISNHINKLESFFSQYQEVIFRIHPKEINNPNLKIPKRFTISTPEDEMFDEVLNRVSDVIGVFSTGLLKAEQLQKRIYLMDIPEKRKIESLLSSKYSIV